MTRSDRLTELFKQAAEIAKQVPASMQEAAFNRALDLLTGTEAPRSSMKQEIGAKRPRRAAAPEGSQPVPERAEVLLASIDSTKYPAVLSASKVLDRSLMVLRIAHKDHEVDGLTANDLSKILTDKFRLSTTPAAVRMALGSAPNLVNRVPEGRSFVYRIMAPGEGYLKKIEESDAAKGAPKVGRSRSPKSKKSVSREKSPGKATTKSNSGRRRSGRRGPGALIKKLAAEGFFKEKRTVADITKHAANNTAHSYTTSELTPSLGRAIRSGILKREKNDEGLYEYAEA